MNEKVFVNRTLNLKKIQWIGFDMDHTLVRYISKNFEELAHRSILQKLVASKSYPEAVLKLPFVYEHAIRGLVLDRRMGNILKLNRYSGIRRSQHGLAPIDFATQKKIYKSIYIDLSDPNYVAVDTTFSISYALLFAQLVEFKKTHPETTIPSFEGISRDLEDCLDEAHRDGSLKDEVRKDLAKFIIPDPELVASLERFKKHGKKLFLLTNSYFAYSKLLLDYAVNPYLKTHKTWVDLFDITITAAQKPRFFYDKVEFLRVDPETGFMTPYEGRVTHGVFHGGCATKFTDHLQVSGEDILYIGDHIYGDILRLKKDCNWRTGLVVEELHEEIENTKKAKPIDAQIQGLMEAKEPIDMELLQLTTEHRENGTPLDDDHVQELHKKVATIDQKITGLILSRQNLFNKQWGEVMRIGNEESLIAAQIERYACIYMSKLSDLLSYSPRTYFRAHRNLMPHEVDALGMRYTSI